MNVYEVSAISVHVCLCVYMNSARSVNEASAKLYKFMTRQDFLPPAQEHASSRANISRKLRARIKKITRVKVHAEECVFFSSKVKKVRSEGFQAAIWISQG